MDTLQENELLRNLPFRDDGTMDLMELGRRQLESMVNQIMDWQADELCGEGNRRNGYRERGLLTPFGEIVLRIPKLREGTYFPSRISRMTSELDEEVSALNARRFEGASFPYLWLDATYLNCRDEGHVQSKGVVTAIACDSGGLRQFVGFGVVDTESAASWKAFLRDLRKRGVTDVRCVVSDDHEGLVQAIAEIYQGAAWQRCIVHLERNVAGWFTRKEDKAVAVAAMKAVFAERDPQFVRAAYRVAAERLAEMKPRAGELLEDAEADALAYLDFPREHHIRLRTNNVQERANEEIKRRTRVVGVFPSAESMMRLVGSVLIDVNEEWLGMNYLDMAPLRDAAKIESGAEPIPREIQEKARIYVMAAIDEKLKKAA